MIPISLEWLVFACLLAFLAFIFLVWVGYDIVHRRRAGEAHRRKLKCPVCSMEFADSSAGALATCPRCGSRTERTPPRQF